MAREEQKLMERGVFWHLEKVAEDFFFLWICDAKKQVSKEILRKKYLAIPICLC